MPDMDDSRILWQKGSNGGLTYYELRAVELARQIHEYTNNDKPIRVYLAGGYIETIYEPDSADDIFRRVYKDMRNRG